MTHLRSPQHSIERGLSFQPAGPHQATQCSPSDPAVWHLREADSGSPLPDWARQRIDSFLTGEALARFGGVFTPRVVRLEECKSPVPNRCK